jgi:hypothetical protein
MFHTPVPSCIVKTCPPLSCSMSSSRVESPFHCHPSSPHPIPHHPTTPHPICLSGALRGVLEVERAFEMLTLGAYYKYSSTAFVTFRTRMAETIAHQMLLTNDMMEICHAPNPHDSEWPLPFHSQKRRYCTVLCCVVCWSDVLCVSCTKRIDLIYSLSPSPL